MTPHDECCEVCGTPLELGDQFMCPPCTEEFLVDLEVTLEFCRTGTEIAALPVTDEASD